ncbi:MAG: glycosyltransferase family 4 protein [Butyrivibrio sp.]|nr:glycosyltransferase family 4 protein [Butyrivibrio sp.]
MKKNLILADCDHSELESFIDGIRYEGIEIYCYSVISNGGREKPFSNFVRYSKYFLTPLKVFIKRKQYGCLVGWQQFYALIFCFWSQLFHVKKVNKVIALNFTYKRKHGLCGVVYEWFMKKCVCNNYLDYMHVPSYEYADIFSKEFGISRDKFIVTAFGVDDNRDIYSRLEKPGQAPKEGYALAIGRSNRDYDYLIRTWEQIDYNLVIISDEYIRSDLPDNITLINDVSGDAQYPWIANCNFMIIPIKDTSICSGDTVLLTAMSLEKTIFVTSPSTLAEMYVENGVNAIFISKDEEESRKTLQKYINNGMANDIGILARKTFLEKYSRYAMGRRVASFLK